MMTGGKISLAVLGGDRIGLSVKNASTSGAATPDLGGTASVDAFAAAVIAASKPRKGLDAHFWKQHSGDCGP